MLKTPIMNGKFTDVLMIELLLNEFMEGMRVNMMCIYKDIHTGEITIHGSYGAVKMVDSEVIDD